MTLEAVTRTIQFILAPVVMVSTCSILLGNLLNRYAVINNRLRSLAQERRTLTRADAPTTMEALPDAPAAKVAPRLQEIDAQMPTLLRRHRLMRRSILIVNHATLVFFVDMLVIALASLEASAGWATGLALLCFLAGIAITAFGLFLSTQEVRTSQLAVLQDIAWCAGIVDASSRAGTGSQTDTPPPPGPFPSNPLLGLSRRSGPTTLPGRPARWTRWSGRARWPASLPSRGSQFACASPNCPASWSPAASTAASSARGPSAGTPTSTPNRECSQAGSCSQAECQALLEGSQVRVATHE